MAEVRPTTKDLAKAAGVSLATVDRVLNGRSGVRQKTVDAVNEAIERIGFIRNISAANLARGRSYRLDFLLPRSGDQFLESLVDRIAEAQVAFAADSTFVRVRKELQGDPHQIAGILSRITPEDTDGVALMAPDSPQVRDATTRLLERGVKVVALVAGHAGEHPVDVVGVDNIAAGATAGQLVGRFCGGRQGKILVVSDTMNAQDSVERRHGFDSVVTGRFPNLVALPTLESYGDEARTRAIIANAFRNHPDIVGTYVLSSEARLALEVIGELGSLSDLVNIAHERTRFTEEMLMRGALDAVIAQNPGHLVRSAIRLLRARCDMREPLASQEEIRIEILIRENLGKVARAGRA
ncbi:substrate-binding domain-containing protein [Rhodobacterales bacterium HKCCE3408]|nr:substrate-binding domain-containing protein [Rhodobacterales bacterium HKCCE3408]